MPKIYEYFGIVVFFYSNEHEPIHVHGRKGECESKAEFIIEQGVIIGIRITNVKGFEPLKGKELSHFKAFLRNYADEVVDRWVDYFVYNKSVTFEKITKKLR
mgnify:CR=1 FL=1|tara:strand:+ start:1461 stop:1766 length:306 start_codon:yes stop_codon:yes gene_type:complete